MKLQSAVLRGADAAAGALGLLDRQFDPAALVAAAQRETGLRDFGDETFREPLDRLLRACADEASLSVIGRTAISWDVRRFLVNLLYMKQAELRSPGIVGEQIRRPIFITGLPRSGTTFLHRLLMLDTANQVPKVWETIFPYPVRGARDADPAVRIQKVARQLRAFERLAPEFSGLHPLRATSPQECSEISAHVFASLRFDTTQHIPSYRHWLDETGHVAAYRFHKRFLQHLQHRSDGERWVLKCPDHVFALDDLREVYPDAQLVFVHRDPVKVLLSVTRLTEVLRRPFARQLDRLAIGRQESARWLEGTRHMVRAAQTDPSIIHVHYSDVTANPLASVEALYDRLDLPLPGAAADAIRQRTEAAPNGGYGVHRYTAEDYGLNLAEESEKFADYTGYFGIETEGRRKRTLVHA